VTNEAPLLPRVARGDPTAVAECLDRYKNLVWSLARRRCPDVETAEDAVQDIFLKLWQIAGRFDASIASETTFVSMIARRSLIDLSRKHSRSSKTTSAIELDNFSKEEMEVDQQAELKHEAARAAAMLEQLPEDQKKVIRLSIYDGLSHSLIADATGLSLGTVKTHIRRGMIKLRKSLFPDDAFAFNSSLAKRDLQ
jgi:RNA polymerase sigma-70 factor (ECF subfamily)